MSSYFLYYVDKLNDNEMKLNFNSCLFRGGF